MASGAPSHNANTELFAAALENFQSSLSDEDRANFKPFQDPSSMIEAIKEPFLAKADKSRLLAACRKVESFAKKLNGFFPVIDIFVSSHPEYAALAWGAIRLVFQLSSRYVNYFDKLADMFESIGERLPFYDRQIELLRARDALTPRLLNALAHVYVDIIQFCQQACKIFSGKAKGIRSKLCIAREVMWKPFDVRFSGLLNRLQKHHDFYNLELSIMDTVQLVDHYNKFEAEIKKNEQQRQEMAYRAAEEEKSELKRRVRHMKLWIDAPPYAQIFDREKQIASPGAGQWLLDNATYQSWRGASINGSPSRNKFSRRVLTIHGSPGYGKTVLSTIAINDLSYFQAPRSESPSTWKVAFFHFDKMNPDPNANMPHQALRAILNQILHHHHQNKDIVDAISIIMDDEGSGQQSASESDLASVLNLVLEQFPDINMYFVLDGVDECAEPWTFLQMIFAICAKSTCKLILLSRPNILMPKSYEQDRYHIRLDKSKNLDDVCRFLHPRIEHLVEIGFLPASQDVEKLVEELSTRANGLFLWAKLMVDYLECSAISPRARMLALQNLNLVEGLDALYFMIFQMLQKRLAVERRTVLKTFQWLAVSYRPLTLDELSTASSLRLHETFSPDLDCIPDFAKNLILMCARLVEVWEDKTVHLIHLSVKEFLTTKALLSQRLNPGEFHVDIRNSHLTVTSFSLSYLVHDVPGSPLSGSGQVVASSDLVSKQFPFLRYATKWCQHAGDALVGPIDEVSPDLLPSLARLLTAFLASEAIVKVWAEASWTYHELNHSEHLQRFRETLMVHYNSSGCVSKHVSLTELIELIPSVRGVQTDWQYLVDEWKYLLLDLPCEVWEPSINCFRTDGFFLGTEVANMTIMSTVEQRPQGESKNGPSGDKKGFSEINLVSQVSADSTRVASILLLCPRKFTAVASKFFQCGDVVATLRTGMGKTLRKLDKISIGWKVRIRIWTTNDATQILEDLEIELPALHIWLMLASAFHLVEADEAEFRAHVSFGPDLNTIMVLHSVIRITGNEYHIQSLGDDELGQIQEKIKRHPRRFKERDLKIRQAIIAESLFSIQGNLLAVVTSDSPHCGPNSTDHYDCSIRLYHNVSTADESPHYRRIAQVSSLDWIGGRSKLMIIHPSNSCIVFVHKKGTFLWNISDLGFSAAESTPNLELKHLTKLCVERLDSLSFSACGTFITGFDPDTNRNLRLPLPNSAAESIPISIATSLPPPNGQLMRLENQYHQQISGSLITTSATGESCHSELKREYGTVSLQITDKAGTSHTAHLLQLPQSAFGTSISPTLLESERDSDSLRLILNKAKQSTYTLSDPQDFALPRLIRREKESVPTFTKKRAITEGERGEENDRGMEHGCLVKRPKV